MRQSVNQVHFCTPAVVGIPVEVQKSNNVKYKTAKLSK
jgi:hypothetical protein